MIGTDLDRRARTQVCGAMSRKPNIEARKALGLRLLWARELVEPNRSEFARKLGVDSSAIRHVEAGRRGPSIALLQRICHSLRISYEYVVEGRLTGVDPELAGLLVAYHPSLIFEAARGSQRTNSPTSTSARPRTPRPSWARGAAV